MRDVDTVFRNARVIDGTGTPAVAADVAVADGRIVAIADPAAYNGAEEIDCTGLVVCPGFIDVHAHDDLAALAPDGLAPKYAQGVTATVVGNCGHGVAPSGAYAAQIRSYSSPVLGPSSAAWPWSDYAAYLRTLRAAQPPIRVHALVPHGVARMSVMGFAARPATAGEERDIVRAIADGLDAGGIGVSFGLMYAPACFAARSELIAIAHEVAARDAILAVHLRAEGEHILDALAEMYAVAAATGAAMHISHLKCTGTRSHGTMAAVIAELERWRSEGLSVTGDVYPYTAGSTTICGMLPAFALEGGVEQLLDRLSDPDFRSRVEHSLTERWDGMENHLLACGPDNIVLTGLEHRDNVAYEGKSVGDVATDRGIAAETALIDLIEQERGRAGIIQHQGSEADLVTALRWPYTMVGSDGLPAAPGSLPHPRLYGTFPRVLHRYADDTFSLEDAIARMTGLPAERFGLSGQGTLLPDSYADLVVFDPATIADNATYQNPIQTPSGIRQVWVGGRPVLRD